MGFEETEEIGPDGKPHIISEKSFNPGGPAPKLTAAQKRQQKAMQKEMAVSQSASLVPPCGRCSMRLLQCFIRYPHTSSRP
jgi:hypothetical protein